MDLKSGVRTKPAGSKAGEKTEGKFNETEIGFDVGTLRKMKHTEACYASWHRVRFSSLSSRPDQKQAKDWYAYDVVSRAKN